jgi:hypothetical protein
MTDRAKKISELQTTSSVANTDKIVVLKDAANTSAASTRAMTINAFAQSITTLVQAPIPNTLTIANSITVASNGTSIVSFCSYSFANGRTGCCDVKVHARDTTSNSVSVGSFVVAVNGPEANLNYSLISELGSNPIKFNTTPLVNTISNTVTLYLNRTSAANSEVNVKYIVTVY